MGDLPLILLVVAIWLAWCAVAHAAVVNPKGCVPGGLAFILCRAYARGLHGLRVEGTENLPPLRGRSEDGVPEPDAGGDGRGIIVVANHTAGVDPALLQACCPFYIRWMMASEMRVALFDGVWAWLEIIFVGEDGKRRGASVLAALREVVGYLKAGGVVGIFPEGRLERPKGVLHPFQPGMGLIVARSGARVLPIVIDGTPAAPTAWGSILRPSRARLRVMPPIDYSGVKPAAIVADLQDRFRGWTGWRVVDPGAATATADTLGA